MSSQLLVTAILSIFIIYIIYLWAKRYEVFALEYSQKNMNLEALRGIAAFGVFLSHSVLSYGYREDKRWWWDNSIFSNSKFLATITDNLGSFSVSIFFMLTSFLFFNKYILNNIENFSTINFYRKRMYRLMPMYFFSIFIVIIIYLFIGIKPNVGIQEALRFIISWISFGYYTGQSISPTVKDGFIVNAGVLWTLSAEWKFYIFFPFLLCLFTTRNQAAVNFFVLNIILFLIAFVGFIGWRGYSIVLYFSLGLLAALLNKYNIFRKVFLSYLVSLIALCVILYFFLYYQNSFRTEVVAGLGFLFAIIANGNSCFGILKLKFLSFLGKISYSVYLLHGIFLFCINQIIQPNAGYIASTIFAFIPTIFTSMLTYKYIEHRFIR